MPDADTVTTDPTTAAVATEVRRRPALSPSRASDFKQCALCYPCRAVDRLREVPTKAQRRGTLVRSVRERLFARSAAERVPAQARELLGPAWTELSTDR